MKIKEEIIALKDEMKALNKELAELSKDEREQLKNECFNDEYEESINKLKDFFEKK